MNCESCGRSKNCTGVTYTEFFNIQEFEIPFCYPKTSAYAIDDVVLLAKNLGSDEPKTRLDAAIGFRQILSKEKNPPVQEVVDTGIVPLLTKYLKNIEEPQLRYECMWSLRNIAAINGNPAAVVVSCGIIPVVIDIIKSSRNRHYLINEAVYTLMNISGENCATRDAVLMTKAPFYLMRLAYRSPPVDTLEAIFTNISNLCRGRPSPNWGNVACFVPFINKFLDYPNLPPACTSNLIWALSYLTDAGNDRIQAIIESEVIPKVMEIMRTTKETSVMMPCLRTFGNVVTGNDDQTEYVLNLDIVKVLAKLLLSTKAAFRKETLWTISNIAAGTAQQIQRLIAAPGLIKSVLRYLNLTMTSTGTSGAEVDDRELQRECLWCIANMSSGGTRGQMEHLVKGFDLLRVLVGQLKFFGENPQMVILALEALHNFFRLGGYNSMHAKSIKSCGAVAYLELFMRSQVEDLARKAEALLSDLNMEIEGKNKTKSSSFPRRGFNF